MKAPAELALVLNSDLSDLDAVGIEIFERFIECERKYNWSSNGTGSVGIVYIIADRLYEVMYDVSNETTVTEVRERTAEPVV